MPDETSTATSFLLRKPGVNGGLYLMRKGSPTAESPDQATASSRAWFLSEGLDVGDNGHGHRDLFGCALG